MNKNVNLSRMLRDERKNTSREVKHQGTYFPYKRKGKEPSEDYSGGTTRTTVFKENNGSNTAYVASGSGRFGREGRTKRHTNVSEEALNRHKRASARGIVQRNIDLESMYARDHIKQALARGEKVDRGWLEKLLSERRKYKNQLRQM